MVSSSNEQIDVQHVAELSAETLDWRHQAIPAAFHGRTVDEFLAAEPHLGNLQTPVLTLDEAAMAHNLQLLASWCKRHSVLLAPHGKTTMAPALWKRQLELGAWGLTLANAHQLRTARAFGVQRIMIANSVTDPQAIAYLAVETAKGAQIISWVDSVRTVRLLERELATTPQIVLPVIVELGALNGRTGARANTEALEIARSVAASPQLALAGVGGYEGSLAHTTDEVALGAVRGYLRRVGELHRSALDEKLYGTDEVIITAGGSAYFDEVASELSELSQEATDQVPAVQVVLRSGAYVIHDDGFYRMISPLGRQDPEAPEALRSAMHAWVRVVSQPEPGLAILDAGKRDLPFDEGLPVPQAVGTGLGREMTALESAAITAVNDQHAFLSFDPSLKINPGDVVRLGLSHPCTALDKWTLLPVLDTAANSNPRIVDAVRTFF
ncbi:amino acid deaminase [Arthrobacter sp. MYb229]|uniref:alanine racemase n=1 Tax=unclassified Arthrobacter TaxID=235627 RepID=UPI000CFC6404|nr:MULTISPECIES: alanine racemase [unclassified Arthrobacter]PRA03005.1 amino acid deaminase [Arthrobacter sp. MYb229]PRB49475.1 amino acid deaminase [Arthrobacter sp. MYb216]